MKLAMIDNARAAILAYQHSERLKSELMIASQLVGEVTGMEANEVGGAVKMISSFLAALLGETRIAYNALGSSILLEADKKIAEVIQSIESSDYTKANQVLAESMSEVTTIANEALQFLIDQELMK